MGQTRGEESHQEYKNMCNRAKKAFAKAKENAYDKLNTKEREKDLYRLAR